MPNQLQSENKLVMFNAREIKLIGGPIVLLQVLIVICAVPRSRSTLVYSEPQPSPTFERIDAHAHVYSAIAAVLLDVEQAQHARDQHLRCRQA